MSASPANQTFPAGLVDSILPELSLSLRNHIIFNWARLFTQSTDQDLSTIEIISTIATLDFSSYRSINPNNFTTLSNLPLSNLKHLDLSHISLADSTCSQILVAVSTSPIFDNLESLNLSDTQQGKFDGLLKGPNRFPKLTTLNLSYNWSLSISALFSTNKLPNLRHLDLSRCGLKNDAAEIKNIEKQGTIWSPTLAISECHPCHSPLPFFTC